MNETNRSANGGSYVPSESITKSAAHSVIRRK
jgi:hypothetical protein